MGFSHLGVHAAFNGFILIPLSYSSAMVHSLNFGLLPYHWFNYSKWITPIYWFIFLPWITFVRWFTSLRWITSPHWFTSLSGVRLNLTWFVFQPSDFSLLITHSIIVDYSPSSGSFEDHGFSPTYLTRSLILDYSRLLISYSMPWITRIC